MPSIIIRILIRTLLPLLVSLAAFGQTPPNKPGLIGSKGHASSAQAHADRLNARRHNLGFFAPNENYPYRSLNIVGDAIPGAYVTVGSERCFMMGGILKQISSLHCVDRDAEINLMNRINIALLKMAKSRENYVFLRLNANLDDWQHCAQSVNLPAAEIELLNSYNFDFWTSNVRNNWGFEHFHKRRDAQAFDDRAVAFSKANYLYIDSVFERVKQLAQSNSIHVANLDLSEPLEIQSYLTKIIQSGSAISVVDVSNAWWSRYAGISSLHNITEILANLKSMKSRILMTVGVANWAYLGFDVETATAAENRGPLSNYLYSLERRSTKRLLDLETDLNGFQRLKCLNNLRP